MNPARAVQMGAMEAVVLGESDDVIRAAIESLKSDMEEMRRTMQAEIDALREEVALERALDRKRLSRLETETLRPSNSAIAKSRLSKIDSLLLERFPRAISFEDAGKLLDMGKNRRQNMTHFAKSLSAQPDKYIIESARGRGNGKQVRITQDYRDHLVELARAKVPLWQGSEGVDW